MGGIVSRRVTHWIANSQNTASILEDQWNIPESKITVVHPGVDIARYHPAEVDYEFRRRMRWDGKYVLLTVGRLQKRKGHDNLILSLPKLLKSYPNLLYAIVGDGEELINLQGVVERLNLERHVQFLGKVSDDDLLRFYQQCDLFILPNRSVGSDIEGFGMVLVEAASCGKPVIAGRSGGTAETLVHGETGFLVDAFSVASLTNELELVLKSPVLATAGAAGRRHVKKNFSWETLVDCVKQTLRRFGEGGLDLSDQD
jgi:phosphatidylinositol alpha-1,6-mannosyltransferase